MSRSPSACKVVGDFRHEGIPSRDFGAAFCRRGPPAPLCTERRHFDVQPAARNRLASRHVESPRLDPLAPRQLAQPPRHPAAQVHGPGCSGARGGGVEPAAAAGGVLGGRGAAREARAGAARRAVPAAGRRLRRELRGLRVGQHRQAPEDSLADEPGAAAGLEETHHPRRPVRRAVRQAALGRHRDARRGDAAQLPRRQRQSAGFQRGGAGTGSGAAAARLRARLAHAELRARADRRRLRRPAPSGVLGSGLLAPRAAARGVSEDRRLDRRVAGVLRVHERHARARGHARRLLHQPRGTASALRAGADPLHRAPEEVVQPVHAHAVDRHAHRGDRRRAHRIFPRHRQSHRREGRAPP